MTSPETGEQEREGEGEGEPLIVSNGEDHEVDQEEGEMRCGLSSLPLSKPEREGGREGWLAHLREI